MSTATTDVPDLLEQSFPRSAPIEQQVRHLLRYAILAPSTRNTQPWRFAVQTNTLGIFADLERRQPVSDPERRELYISVGCALENLLVAAEHHGFGHEVTYFPQYGNDEFVAHIAFAPGGTPSPARAGITLETMLRRHNDNSVYRPVPVPEEARRRLEACREEAELRLDLTDDHVFRRWVDELTLEADRFEFGNPSFRRELGYWIGQGVFGTRKLLSRLGRLAITRFDLGEPVARQDEAMVKSAALLGLISAASDTHLTHVQTGQLFERLWLMATDIGISIHPMSPAMRVPALRTALGELLPTSGWIPQHLFRVGYSAKPGIPRHRTPRRALRDVMLDWSEEIPG
jgi:nitroreductase